MLRVFGVTRDGYDNGYDDYSRGYSSGPRDLLRPANRCGDVGRIVNIMDNGNNINGSVIASSLTILVDGVNCGMNVLSTSVANPSVPGSFNVGSGICRGRVNVLPTRARGNVGVVSVGLLLRSGRTPIL